MRIVTLSFPVDQPCSDTYCPVAEYGQHSHTLYNLYAVPERFHVPGMSESDAAEIASSVRFNESAPVNFKKGTLQNV